MAGQADPASGQNLHSQGHAAAIWRLPDQVLTARPFSVLHAEGRALADLFGADLPRALDAMAILEATHPVEPHVYLAAIGTEPAWRGRGLASDLLGQGLALADAQGLPTYLETTAQDPCLFTKAGFEVLGHVAPLGGPTITRMRRAAKIG